RDRHEDAPAAEDLDHQAQDAGSPGAAQGDDDVAQLAHLIADGIEHRLTDEAGHEDPGRLARHGSEATGRVRGSGRPRRVTEVPAVTRGAAGGQTDAVNILLAVVAVLGVSLSGPLMAATAAPVLAIAFWRNALATGLLAPFALTGHRAAIVAQSRRGLLLALI